MDKSIEKRIPALPPKGKRPFIVRSKSNGGSPHAGSARIQSAERNRESAHFNPESMLHRVDGDREFVGIIMDIGLADITEKLPRLISEIGAENWKQVQHTAHSLKGLARSLSMDVLADMAEKAEKLSASDQDLQTRPGSETGGKKNEILRLARQMAREFEIIKTLDLSV